MTFESAIPEDMQAVIEKWTNYAENSMKNGDVN
jgi:hypothetical protein